jgi:hypothetical protein
MKDQTTGQTVSRMAVLTVLTQNALAENRLDADTRRAHRKELVAIVNGRRGVDPGKVAQRSVERCVAGRWN